MLSSRRDFLSAGAALLSTPALAAIPDTPEHQLAFRIMRKGSRIGTHTVNFSRGGNGLAIAIAVDMAVGFGPIVLFRYSHSCIERWGEGMLQSVDGKTNFDGEPAWCKVHRDAEGLIVEGSKAPRYRAPANALPATHWNRAELSGPMISPQDGQIERPTINEVGTDNVALATGADVRATHYTWRGEDILDLWYDSQSQWTGLRAVTSGGDVLSYERL